MRDVPLEPDTELAEQPKLSIIVPTYCECENLGELIEQLRVMREENAFEIEMIIVDDNSQDGTQKMIDTLDEPWVQLIVRTDERGLSSAVIEGMEQAKGDVLVCMDADLSHHPKYIPKMVLALRAGYQMVVGSRYVEGGSTDDDWGLLRWFNSVIATFLARPLTFIKDPMSGFFMLRRADFAEARYLNPIGYKIGLELIVKCGFENVGEIPIHFTDRVRGKSKLSLKEQLRYLQHLRRLYIHRFANRMHMLQFFVVGLSGTVVNILVLTLLSAIGMSDPVALAGGISVSLMSNFLLNRRFTFSYARHRNFVAQFLGFLGASAVGLIVNYGVALYLRGTGVFDGPYALQIAALVGILSGMMFNFLANRYIVFRKQFVRKRSDRG